MTLLRSDRFSAVLLVTAAAIGLVIANSALAPTAAAIEAFHLGIPGIGLDLTVGHWITDGLLAVFFFLAAIELRHELHEGELDSIRKALVPAIAAVGGVLVPAVVYLLIVRDQALWAGWPVPTATDIAFALGVLAIFGRGLPATFRALLLAIAVIDDLIAILIIAIFFTDDLAFIPLLSAIPVIALFGWLSRKRPAVWLTVALVVLGIAAWILVYSSGVHPTIAGVALGLVMYHSSAARTRHGLEPWSNVVILPLFALVASLVPIPSKSIVELSPAFWGVLIALPVGKLVGVSLGALLAMRIFHKDPSVTRMPGADVMAIAGLAGIGFTVSLLMNELAFESNQSVANEVTLSVLVASVIAAIIGGGLTAMRGRHYLRLDPRAANPPTT